MSDKDLIQNVPALHAMLAAHAGTIATGSMPGLDPAVVPNDDALNTGPDASPEMILLHAQQQDALENLMEGKSYTAVAHAAGVNRRTLYRWVNHDPAFRAAMEAWRGRAVRTTEDRLTQGTEIAAATLTTAAARDFRAAAVLLKGRGMLPGPPSQHKPLDKNPLVLSIPPGKRRDFEIRLRELILSFRDEDATSPETTTVTVAPQIVDAGVKIEEGGHSTLRQDKQECPPF